MGKITDHLRDMKKERPQDYKTVMKRYDTEADLLMDVAKYKNKILEMEGVRKNDKRRFNPRSIWGTK